MSHGDDDEGNDVQLRSLRAVWLDMPDEEPPERGLADLLAAARTKASEMAAPEPAPSWWKRIAALLRRPPVLALATVMLLVGGIVLVGHHDEKAGAPSVSAPAGGEATTTKEQEAAPQSPPPREDVAGPKAVKQTPRPRALEVREETIDESIASDKVQGLAADTTATIDAGVPPIEIEKTGAAIDRATAEPAQ